MTTKAEGVKSAFMAAAAAWAGLVLAVFLAAPVEAGGGSSFRLELSRGHLHGTGGGLHLHRGSYRGIREIGHYGYSLHGYGRLPHHTLRHKQKYKHKKRGGGHGAGHRLHHHDTPVGPHQARGLKAAKPFSRSSHRRYGGRFHAPRSRDRAPAFGSDRRGW